MSPELHVLAGPNGIGKTTGYDLIVPKHVSYINADMIAKEIKAKAGGLNVMDIANPRLLDIFLNAWLSGRPLVLKPTCVI